MSLEIGSGDKQSEKKATDCDTVTKIQYRFRISGHGLIGIIGSYLKFGKQTI